MNAKDIIDEVDRLMPNVYSSQDKINWINRLEKDICKNINSFTVTKMDTVADQEEYAVDIDINDIHKLFVNTVEYEKLTEFNQKPYCFYAKTQGKIALFPVPVTSTTDGIMIVHRAMPIEKTVEGTEELAFDYPDMYRFWLCSQIHLCNKEYDDYNNTAILYNMERMKLNQKYHHEAPDTTNCRLKNYW